MGSEPVFAVAIICYNTQSVGSGVIRFLDELEDNHVDCKILPPVDLICILGTT